MQKNRKGSRIKHQGSEARPPGQVKLPQAKAKNARKPRERTYGIWWAPVTINRTLETVHQSLKRVLGTCL